MSSYKAVELGFVKSSRVAHVSVGGNAREMLTANALSNGGAFCHLGESVSAYVVSPYRNGLDLLSICYAENESQPLDQKTTVAVIGQCVVAIVEHYCKVHTRRDVGRVIVALQQISNVSALEHLVTGFEMNQKYAVRLDFGGDKMLPGRVFNKGEYYD